MNLYISGSNRKKNSYQFLKNLMTEKDKLISLADLDIKYCIGCCACMKKLPNYCVLEDDMRKIYDLLIEADKIIIMSPIYMNQITEILKNMIDRLNPFCYYELMKNKKLYLITVGQMNEKENQEVEEDIKKYFEGICEFFYLDFVYLKNLSSGEIETIDSIKKVYGNDYNNIISKLKEKIGE